jgi:multidrug efflux pump subunit AcrB
MNISAWSIRNPVVPIILFVGLILMGMVSFSQMKIQDMPDIEFPAVAIMIGQPGAAPTEIETQITQKVESAVRSISGVDSMSSTATEGNSQTFVMFQIGVDVNEAVNEVKNAVDQARGELPDGILEPRVFKLEGGAGEIAGWAVSADDMTLEQLSWFIDDTVSKRLLAIGGLATVERSGGVTREIRVTLDPARMQSLGVSASQVNGVLRQLNTNAAGGKAEIAGSRQSVRVLGNAKSAYELSQADIPIGGGRVVKLADFADVSDSNAEVTSAGKMNGKPVVTFEISRARGASDVSVYDAAIIELAKLEKERPGLHFTRLFASVDYTKKQYESSIAAMVEGAILAVIVVFFFLRDWRATVISAIAIPLSAIPTFWFLYTWFGFSLNSLSLLALGLVAGVLVDDAIVEIENIVRHMRMGQKRLSGLHRRGRRDRPCGGGDDVLDCRGVPAGGPDGRDSRPVLQEFRPHRGHLGAAQPGRGADDHADGCRLFPEIARCCRTCVRSVDGPLHARAALDARYEKGRFLSPMAGHPWFRGHGLPQLCHRARTGILGTVL